MYYTYILYSKKLNRYYVGSTQDLSSRLLRHNCGDGCKYTKVGIPWDLVYSESYCTRKEAVNRELFIKKKKSRVYIEQLIASVG